MWIKRTPEEIAQWEKGAERQASSHGWIIAGPVWVLVSVFAASGFYTFLFGGTVVATQQSASDSFWFRLPIFGVVAAPFVYWIFRHERKKELAKIKRRTICTQCDTAASSNAGTACECGGSFVPSSTMKWIEK